MKSDREVSGFVSIRASSQYDRDDSAKALASIPYYDDSFKVRRLYSAWDNLGDEELLLSLRDTLAEARCTIASLLIYMLIGDKTRSGNGFHRKILPALGLPDGLRRPKTGPAAWRL